MKNKVIDFLNERLKNAVNEGKLEDIKNTAELAKCSLFESALFYVFISDAKDDDELKLLEGIFKDCPYNCFIKFKMDASKTERKHQHGTRYEFVEIGKNFNLDNELYFEVENKWLSIGTRFLNNFIPDNYKIKHKMRNLGNYWERIYYFEDGDDKSGIISDIENIFKNTIDSFNNKHVIIIDLGEYTVKY